MLVLGHAGITLGAAALLQSMVSRKHPFVVKTSNPKQWPSRTRESVPFHDSVSTTKASPLMSLANRIDVRLLLIGSLLPDIVDKPLGQYLFRDIFNTGRILCHTLLFVVLMTLVGLLLHRSRGTGWLLVLAFGSLAHLILDEMWLTPRTLFWPFLGLTFERIELTDLTTFLIDSLSEPTVFIAELVGATILIWLFTVLARNRTVWAFIRHGEVGRVEHDAQIDEKSHL